MKQRRNFRGQRQAYLHGKACGHRDFRIGALPGMETFPRPPDWSMKETQRRLWAQFDRGLFEGYLTAALAADLLGTPKSV